MSSSTPGPLQLYESQRAHYINVATTLRKYSGRFAVTIGLVLIIYKIMISLSWLHAVTGTVLFLTVLSLCIFGFTIVSHYRYKQRLDDPDDELSKSASLFTQPAKTFSQRTVTHRRYIDGMSGMFWTGVAISVIVLLMLIFYDESFRPGREKSLQGKGAGTVVVDLLQVNDVYEVSPLDSGRIGGMARIATLKKKIQQQNENTLLLMAGDFISPSVFNSVKENNVSITGKQMIEAMNLAGVDLAIFGNHEFDVKKNILQQRIDESWFRWISSNVMQKDSSGKRPFQQKNVAIPESWVKTFAGPGGNFTIGFMALTIGSNKGDGNFADIGAALPAARRVYQDVAAGCDAVIAITHQDLKDDSLLAVAIPGLTAIIGGHEHDMRFLRVGNVLISKAHSNARSAFHLKINYNSNANPQVTVIPSLIKIDEKLEEDALTKEVCDKWMMMAEKYFGESGFAPGKIMCRSFDLPLDGRDEVVRFQSSNLTTLIADAMLAATAAKGAEIAIFNAGSIRVDDFLSPPITQYSILRALPFGGAVRIAEMNGSFIKKLIDSAANLKGEGAFLVYSDNFDKSRGTLNGTVIADASWYKVAIAEYLTDGKQNKLNYIKDNARLIDSAGQRNNDIRKMVIDYLEKTCSTSAKLSKYK